MIKVEFNDKELMRRPDVQKWLDSVNIILNDAVKEYEQQLYQSLHGVGGYTVINDNKIRVISAEEILNASNSDRKRQKDSGTN